MDEENKTRKIEAEVKAPDSIRRGVQSTLNTYRMIGDVASLYLHDLSQTLIGFTDLFQTTPNEKKPPNEEKDDSQ